MTEREIRRLYQRDLNRYLKFAYREFYKGLKEQVGPALENPYAQISAEPMTRAYTRVYEYAGVDQAKKEYARIKKQEGTKVELQLLLATWRLWMRDYVVNNLATMITNVSQNTQDAINRALQDGLDAGDTQTQLFNRIYKYTLGEIGRVRARLIGRTEVTRATNVGKRRSADDYSNLNNGITMYKKWIHVPQKENRDTHVAEGNKPPIPIDDDFQVLNQETGGITLMAQPGDPTAGAAQTCNCGCTVIYMSERFARRNYKM